MEIQGTDHVNTVMVRHTLQNVGDVLSATEGKQRDRGRTYFYKYFLEAEII